MLNAVNNSSVTQATAQTVQPQSIFDSNGKNVSMMLSEMLAGVNSISESIRYLKDHRTDENEFPSERSISEIISKTVSDMRQSVYDGYMSALADNRQMDSEAKEREAMLTQNAQASKKPDDGKTVYDLLQKETPDSRRAVNSEKQVTLLKALVDLQNAAINSKDSLNASDRISGDVVLGGVMNWFRTNEPYRFENDDSGIVRQMMHTGDKKYASEPIYKFNGMTDDTSGIMHERSAGKKLSSLVTPVENQIGNITKRSLTFAPLHTTSSARIGSQMESGENISSLSGAVKTVGSLVTGMPGAETGRSELRRDDGKLIMPSLSIAANVDKIRAMHESISEHTKQIHLLLMNSGDHVTTETESLPSKLPGMLKTVITGLGLGAAAAGITYAVTRVRSAVNGFGVISKAFGSVLHGGMSWMSETKLGSFMKSNWLKATERIGNVAKPMFNAVTGQFTKVGNAITAGGRAFMSWGGLAGKALDGTKTVTAGITATGAKAINAVKGAVSTKAAAFAAKHASIGKGVKLGSKLANPLVSAGIDAAQSGYYLHKGNYSKAIGAGLNAAAYAIPGVGAGVGTAGELIRMGVPAAMDAVDTRLDKSRYREQLKGQGLTDDELGQVVSGKANPDSFARDATARTLASKYGVDDKMTKNFLEAKYSHGSNGFKGDFKQYYSTMKKYMSAASPATVRVTPLNHDKLDGTTQAERDVSRAKMTAKELVLAFSTSPAIQVLLARTAERSGTAVGATLGG